jgi:type VI secretion system (T6SS) effector Hcp
MHGRARSRRQDEQERTAPRRGTARPAGADAVLELQRGAGNQAVSSLLARETKDKEKPKEEAAAGTRATLPDIGTIPLTSVQFGGSRGPGRRREEDDEKDTSGEIVLSSRVGKHSQRLLKASLDGKSMTVEVVIAGSGGNVRLELKGAMISSYSTGSGGGEEIETWTLNFQSMEQEVKQGDSE